MKIMCTGSIICYTVLTRLLTIIWQLVDTHKGEEKPIKFCEKLDEISFHHLLFGDAYQPISCMFSVFPTMRKKFCIKYFQFHVFLKYLGYRQIV